MTLFRAIRCDVCGRTEAGYTGDKWFTWTPRGAAEEPRHKCPDCETPAPSLFGEVS